MTRTFDAGIQRVWDAWTKPENLTHWLGCGGSNILELSADVRVGGELLVTLAIPEGGPMKARGVYQILEPPTKLAYTWKWLEGAPIEIPETLVTVELAEVEEGTLLTLTHTKFPSREIAVFHQGGWGPALESLAAFLAKE